MDHPPPRRQPGEYTVPPIIGIRTPANEPATYL